MTHRIVSGAAFIICAVFSTAIAQPIVIDFEGLSLGDGSPIGAIGIASFDGHAAAQGAPNFAFIGPPGADTGITSPFNLPLNTFLTNVGGGSTPTTVKTITIEFSQSVAGLSFMVCDIDRGGDDNIEQFTAEAFDAAMNSLALITHTAPGNQSGGGDGEVTPITFGSLGGIRRLVLTLQNLGDPEFTALGWGIDNIQFTAGSVPAVSTWGLLVMGLAVISAATCVLRLRSLSVR